jgi:DNA-binding CsgD family transcriptional regulator
VISFSEIQKISARERRIVLMKFSELTNIEIEKILKDCNLTEDETEIFVLSSKGKSITEISYYCSISERTVNRKIKKIKEKINKIGG